MTVANNLICVEVVYVSSIIACSVLVISVMVHIFDIISTVFFTELLTYMK